MNPIFIILGLVVAFALLGFMFSLSIKKHDAKMATMKKKKGRNKYTPEFKKPGR